MDKRGNAMTRILKIAAALAVLASLGACTVVPPQVAYTGPSIGIVSVGPAPYYRAPPAYYSPPPGYWRGHRNSHRHHW
jgi:hypothetical protein